VDIGLPLRILRSSVTTVRWRTTMFTSIRGAAAVGLLLSLVFLGDADACRRGRHRQRCDCIPSWVRWKDVRNVPNCTLPHTCWCCDGGHWIGCNTPGATCQSGTMTCWAGQPPYNCPARDGDECGGHCGSDNRLYAMVCGRISHRMRFALPWEDDPTEFGWCPLWALGRKCTLPDHKSHEQETSKR
jgi:hypothetical protein